MYGVPDFHAVGSRKTGFGVLECKYSFRTFFVTTSKTVYYLNDLLGGIFRL